ncbi:MAG TPA: glycosyltransferase family 39 protein [Candidatus Hydrogenedentes bacterium]|nr:glycosyltransferase family 39 protein [Candidatus Hydrogenedentota bacterium]HRK33558.1 glycosyltransferase family 39 protein [Candidatus Hydrogenedentota bacterium]
MNSTEQNVHPGMPSDQEPGGMTLSQWLALGALLAVAVALRLHAIASESIWFDESITYTWLDSPTIFEFFRGEAIRDPATVPIYYGVAYLWYHLGFTSIVGMRLLSVIAGTLGIMALYFFGRRLFGHIGGLTAAACMTFAKLQIYMSQEIRNYAFTLLFAIVAMYALNEAANRGRRNWWAVNIIASIAVALTHFFGLLLPFAQGVYLLASRPRQIKWIAVWAAVQLPFYALIPLWVNYVQSGQVEAETQWINWTPLSRAFDAYYFVFAGSLQDALDFVRRLPWGIPVHHILGMAFLLAGAGYLAFCAYAVRHKFRLPIGYEARTSFMLMCWLFVPPATLFLMGRLIRPCFVERYVLYSALPLFLVMGGAIAALPKRSLQYGALGLLLAVYAGNLYDYNRPLRPDYASTGAILRDQFNPGERLFASLDYIQLPMKYYAGIPYEANFGNSDTFLDEAFKEARGGKRAWIWFVEVPKVWEFDAIDAKIRGGEFQVEHWVFHGRWATHLYRIEPKVSVAEHSGRE